MSGDDVSYAGEFVKVPASEARAKTGAKNRGPPIWVGAHDPKYALKRVARYGDGWCPGGLASKKRASVSADQNDGPGIRPRSREARVSVLLMGGDGPTAAVMKQYEEAGVGRLVVAASAVSDDGVKVVRGWRRLSSAAAKL